MVTVFDRHQGFLDDATRETIRSLCDLARMAIEHRQLYDQVVHGSHYDRLTGLPNRILLEDRLRQAMVIARRQGTLVAVCCIDLDHFKQINDSLGHELGDVCFKAVSERLKASIREIDTLARHGGDEFILALRDLAEISDAANICNRLLKDLSAPMLVDGHSLTITASIGISIFPDHGDTQDLLLRNADMALQEAKHAGRGQVQIYSPALGRQSRRAAEMVDALVTAIAQAQFRIAYQPIYTMNREIVGFEALLRWKHPTWGQVSPLEFIPIAEKTGLIVPIGDWVIDEVCRQAMEWNAAAVPPVKIFANVSGVQLGRPDFSSKIAEALERSGLAPERLELEITESWIISDLRGAAGKLQQAARFGHRHCHRRLRHRPLDLQLPSGAAPRHPQNRSLVHPSSRRFCCQPVHGACDHGAGTTAGAENRGRRRGDRAAVRQLAEIGCELVQGFFLARPLTPEAACSLLMTAIPLPRSRQTRTCAECLSQLRFFLPVLARLDRSADTFGWCIAIRNSLHRLSQFISSCDQHEGDSGCRQ